LLVVGENFNFTGDRFDAARGPAEKDSGRLSWRLDALFRNLGMALSTLFDIPLEETKEADRSYAFSNIVKCSPSNKVSPRSKVSTVQLLRCSGQHAWLRKDVLELKPGAVMCLGRIPFDHALAQFTEERMRLPAPAVETGRAQFLRQGIMALCVDHLSGGLRSINAANKRFRESGLCPKSWPADAPRTWEELVDLIERRRVTPYGKNLVLTYRLLGIRDALIRAGTFEGVKASLRSGNRQD